MLKEVILFLIEYKITFSVSYIREMNEDDDEIETILIKTTLKFDIYLTGENGQIRTNREFVIREFDIHNIIYFKNFFKRALKKV
jgi:hypothetical protein